MLEGDSGIDLLFRKMITENTGKRKTTSTYERKLLCEAFEHDKEIYKLADVLKIKRDTAYRIVKNSHANKSCSQGDAV